MNETLQPRKIVTGILICLVGFVFLLVWYSRPAPEVTGSGSYYSGPRPVKGDPNHMVDEKGNLTPVLPGSLPKINPLLKNLNPRKIEASDKVKATRP